MDEYHVNGRLWRRFNDVTRLVYEWDTSGVPIGTPRPYNAQEIAAGTARLAELAAANNETSILTELTTALDTMQAIIALGNNQITGGHTKDIARTMRRVIRILIRRFDGTT